MLASGGEFELNKYPDETTESGVTGERKDRIWGAHVGLRYDIKEWVFAETRYEYKKRDSRFATFDYENNKVTTTMSLIF